MTKIRIFNSFYTEYNNNRISRETVDNPLFDELIYGHIGIEINGITYGFRPNPDQIEKLHFKRIFLGSTKDDSDLFKLANQIIEVKEKSIDLSSIAKKSIISDFKNNKINPYTLIPHRVNEKAYNCISYLRDLIGIKEIPDSNFIKEVFINL